jgi:hypothetical protein
LLDVDAAHWRIGEFQPLDGFNRVRHDPPSINTIILAQELLNCQEPQEPSRAEPAITSLITAGSNYLRRSRAEIKKGAREIAAKRPLKINQQRDRRLETAPAAACKSSSIRADTDVS